MHKETKKGKSNLSDNPPLIIIGKEDSFLRSNSDRTSSSLWIRSASQAEVDGVMMNESGRAVNTCGVTDDHSSWHTDAKNGVRE